jgi:photosystem II stability/assembly factor-like uncharacterized protein
MHPWFDVTRHDIQTESSFPDDVVALQLQVVHHGSARCVVAATTRGIRWSNDGARNWHRWSDDSANAVIESVMLSPQFADDQIVSAISNGILVESRDAGLTWQQTLAGSEVLAAATAHTEDGQALIFAGTETDGVLRSSREQAWESINAGLLDLTITAIAISPQFERDRTILLGTPTGLYRSRNGGDAWRELDLGLIDPGTQVIAFSPDYACNGDVFVGTESSGLFASNDGGRTWTSVSAIPASSIIALAYGDHGQIAVAGTDGSWISPDDGVSWYETGIGRTAISLAVLAEPEGASLLLGYAQGGIHRVSK